MRVIWLRSAVCGGAFVRCSRNHRGLLSARSRLLEHGVLPVRVALACQMLTDADLDKVQRAFTYACKQVARFLDDRARR